jgi:hypothetical protein
LAAGALRGRGAAVRAEPGVGREEGAAGVTAAGHPRGDEVDHRPILGEGGGQRSGLIVDGSQPLDLRIDEVRITSSATLALEHERSQLEQEHLSRPA